MNALAGLVASLVVAHGGTNGLDPSSIYLIRDLEQFRIVDQELGQTFADWLDQAPEERASTVAYFVRCAFEPKTVIRFRTFEWPGVFGLAADDVAPLLQQIATGKLHRPTQLVLRPEAQKWVSSCLMAFANKKGLHEYVSLRGNPPGGAAKYMRSTAEERWARGYPEGVFFADVLDFGRTTASPALPGAAGTAHGGPSPNEVLERSYTLSLHLPENDTGCSPPLASRGREYDYARETKATYKPPGGTPFEYRAARRLGTFQAIISGATKQPANPADPVYKIDGVCVVHGDQASVVDCGQTGAKILRPLFVHVPLLVSLAAAQPRVVPPSALPIEAFSTGKRAVADSTAVCLETEACQRPFELTAACPSDPNAPTLVQLRTGHKIEVVLRHPSGVNKDASPRLGEAFTALVLYRSKESKAGRWAGVEVIDRNGKWRSAGREWPATKDTWRWMQVYPAYPVQDAKGGLALTARISGPAEGEEGPQVNVAGFVDGPPWCWREEKAFMGTCPDSEGPGGLAGGLRGSRR